MKKLLLLLGMFMLTFNSFSQKKLSSDYSYSVSAPYKVFDAGQKVYFSKGNEAIAIKLDGKEVLIQKFNTEKPSFIKEKKYEKFFPKNYSVEDVLEIGEKFYLFYSSWDGDNDKEQLFSVEIDFATGEFLTQKLMFQVDGKIAGTMTRSGGFMGGFSLSVQDKFDIFRSYDKKNILVQYRKKPEVKNDKKSFDIIGLAAFDNMLNEISNREVTMPYTERRMNNLDYQLDNDGNLYLLVKVFHDDSNDDKKKKKDVVANYHLELFLIKNGSVKIEISKFENKEKFITKLWIFDSSKDFLVCGGFYSNGKGDLDDSDGILAFKIDKSGKIYNEVYHDIPVSVLNQYESNKTKKKNEKKERKGEEAKFSDLELRDLFINEDGSLVLVGEQYFMKTHTTTSMNGGVRTYFTFHYNDILVTKIGVNGELKWMNKIPKTQKGSRGQGGMSYKHFYANNNHYLVFLDNVKNIDLPIDKIPAMHSDGQGGYLTAVKISDEDGVSKKASIFNGRELNDFQMHQFSVDRILKTSENSFMLEIYKKKKEDVMIKVTSK